MISREWNVSCPRGSLRLWVQRLLLHESRLRRMKSPRGPIAFSKLPKTLTLGGISGQRQRSPLKLAFSVKADEKTLFAPELQQTRNLFRIPGRNRLFHEFQESDFEEIPALRGAQGRSQ